MAYIPFSQQDLMSPDRLERVLRQFESTINQNHLAALTAAAQPSPIGPAQFNQLLQAIRDELQAGGSAPLNITNLPGNAGPANPHNVIATPPLNNNDFILGAGDVHIKDSGFLIVPINKGGTGSINGFQEGTWTPGITFGGGSTGLTYAQQQGYWLLITSSIGSWAWLTGTVVLSNEGSSTGAMLITGLPQSPVSSANNNAVVNFFISGFQSLTGGIQGAIAPGGSTISMYQTKNGAPTQLDNTDATNSSGIFLSTFFKVA